MEYIQQLQVARGRHIVIPPQLLIIPFRELRHPHLHIHTNVHESLPNSLVLDFHGGEEVVVGGRNEGLFWPLEEPVDGGAVYQ